jgi:hypothetical protein
MLSKDVPLDSKHTETAPLSSDEDVQVHIRVNPAQINQLCHLGVLDASQAEAGREAGGMDVAVSASLVARFRQQNTVTAPSDEIEKLAQRLHAAGLTTPARLFLAAGKPLSFFGSQMLLLAQPASRLLFREQDPAGHFYRLLEDRANVDRLLRRLDDLEADQKAVKTLRPGVGGRVTGEKKSFDKESFRKINSKKSNYKNESPRL